MNGQWWGGCYRLSSSPGLLLEEEAKGFPPKHVLSLTPLTSLCVPQFPLPLEQLCWTHAAMQAEDFPSRQHLLPKWCPAWLPKLPGRETSPFFCYSDEPLGRG